MVHRPEEISIFLQEGNVYVMLQCSAHGRPIRGVVGSAGSKGMDDHPCFIGKVVASHSSIYCGN